MIDTTIQAHPLHWPMGFPRTSKPKNSRFDTSFKSCRDGVVMEIKRLGGKSAIISTNVPLRNDGLPYAKFKKPDDAGVAVYFQYEGEQVVFACDKWQSVEENMQAIRKTIEAIRGLDRWGVSDMLKRAFTGFKALPETVVQYESPWWEILGVSDDCTVQELKDAYKAKAMTAHPDKGGSESEFVKIQEAYKMGLRSK